MSSTSASNKPVGEFVTIKVPWLTPEGTHRGVSIVAVRQAQVRLYGTLCNVGATRGLLITELDPAKKSNKADKSLLDKAAQEVIKLRKN